MNSGCYGNDISKVLISIKVIDLKSCREKEIKRDEIEFFYRGSNLSNELNSMSELSHKLKIVQTKVLYV